MRALLLTVAALAVSAMPRTGADVHGTASVGGKPAGEVIVWFDVATADRAALPSRIHDHVVLDQRNLSFSPHVLAVQVGTVVEFPNHDRVFHNVFSFRDGKTFDLGLYPVGAVKNVTFDKAGLSRIFCNIHPHMSAYVMAVNTPFFAVSAVTGAFAIADVPSGTVTWHAWRAGVEQPLTGTYSVGSGNALDITWP